MAQPARRHYDSEVDPLVQMYVTDEVGKTRHLLRNEFTVALVDLSSKLTVLATSVTESQTQQSLEHADVRGAVERLHEDVTNLQKLFGRVRKLENADELDVARDETREKILAKLEANRRWTVGTIIAAAGLVSALYASLPN